MDFGPIFERSESTNACPMKPTPAGSPVPRAKTTSTSGQDPAVTDGAAAADGTGTLASAQAAVSVAHANRTMSRGLTLARIPTRVFFSNIKGPAGSEGHGRGAHISACGTEHF